MLRNYFLINIVLVLLLGFLGFKFYKVITYTMEIPSEVAVPEDQKSKDVTVKFKAAVPDKASFEIISGKDLFRPARTAPVTNAKTTPASGRAGNPKLFATIVRGSESIAIIEDPNTNKTKPYRINDLVGGFVVSEILADRVILSAGDEKIEVKLREDKGIKTAVPQTLFRQNTEKDNQSRPVPVRRTPSRRLRRSLPSENTLQPNDLGLGEEN